MRSPAHAGLLIVLDCCRDRKQGSEGARAVRSHPGIGSRAGVSPSCGPVGRRRDLLPVVDWRRAASGAAVRAVRRAWKSEDGPSRMSLAFRNHYWDHAMCWLDPERIAVGGFGEDDDWMIDGAGSAPPPRLMLPAEGGDRPASWAPLLVPAAASSATDAAGFQPTKTRSASGTSRPGRSSRASTASYPAASTCMGARWRDLRSAPELLALPKALQPFSEGLVIEPLPLHRQNNRRSRTPRPFHMHVISPGRDGQKLIGRSSVRRTVCSPASFTGARGTR